ncbi:hypothetical protein, partial [Streptomyces globisporus]|uniref:hypothetical protein n=1 Tax=Streptomyces globisporus TaxID=1908 RepID=UPI00347C0466
EDLEALGVVWDPADAAWEENLSAAKAYFAAYETLAAPNTAMDVCAARSVAVEREKPPGHAHRRAAPKEFIDGS